MELVLSVEKEGGGRERFGRLNWKVVGSFLI